MERPTLNSHRYDRLASVFESWDTLRNAVSPKLWKNQEFMTLIVSSVRFQESILCKLTKRPFRTSWYSQQMAMLNIGA